MNARKVMVVSSFCVALALGTGCASSRHAQSTGEYIDSRALNAKVKTALLADSDVKGTDVSVNVWRSVVQLNGFVETEDQRRRAEEIAWSIAGVRGVENNLGLKPEVETALGAPAGTEAGTRVEPEDPTLLFNRVIANPSFYYGSKLALEAEVDQIVARDAFTIKTPAGRGGQMLIMAEPDLVRDIAPGDIVRVEGLFQEFKREEVQTRLNVPLEEQRFRAFENTPVVFADSVSEQGQEGDNTERPRQPAAQTTSPPQN